MDHESTSFLEQAVESEQENGCEIYFEVLCEGIVVEKASVKITDKTLRVMKMCAAASGKTLSQWMEEAANEKVARERTNAKRILDGYTPTDDLLDRLQP